MFCPECGKQIPDDAIFCEHCGARCAQEPARQPAPAVPPPPEKPPAAYAYSPAFKPPVSYDPQAGAVPRPPRKPVSKKAKILSVLAAAVIVLGAAGFGVASSLCSPKNIAKTYFKDLTGGKWDAAYQKLDLAKGDFTSSGFFQTYMESSMGDTLEGIQNYSVSESKDLNSMLGSSADSLTKTFSVQYTEKGQSDIQAMSVTMVRQKGKKLLLFDDWKVSSSDMLAQSYQITVPKNAALTVDGIAVDQSYLANDSSSSSALVTYSLTNIFLGEHKIGVAAPYSNPYTDTIDIQEGGSQRITTLSLSTDTFTALSDASKKAIQSIYDAATSGKSFDAVKALFSADAAKQKDAKARYDALVKIVGGSGTSSKTVKDFKLVSSALISASGDPVLSEKNGVVALRVEVSYTYSLTLTNYSGEVTSYTQAAPRSDYVMLNLVNTGGNWLIDSASYLDFNFPSY